MQDSWMAFISFPDALSTRAQVADSCRRKQCSTCYLR